MSQPLQILLIEDSDDDALLILETLKEDDFQVSCQHIDNRQALLQHIEAGDNWNVIICDHNLPGFSSIDALKILTENNIEAPFVIVSGAIGEEVAVNAMKAGAHDYIMKDNLSRLAPAVRNALKAAELKWLHRQAEKELQHSRERLRDLANYIEQARENERAKIARDMHDVLGSNLAALKMDVSWLNKLLSQEIPKAGEKLQSMSQLVDDTIGAMRRIISDLRPSVLDNLGLIAAIDWLLKEFEQRYNITCLLDSQVDHDVSHIMDKNREVIVFRILQEALTNVARHAKADQVKISIEMAEQQLILVIHDNGCGFDEKQTAMTKSYGLLGMRERAREVGGNLSVNSDIGKGTQITLSIKLTQQSESTGEL